MKTGSTPTVSTAIATIDARSHPTCRLDGAAPA
jgi:hypothetical protein